MNLIAAENAQSLHGSNQSDSGSIGISFGTGGFGISASASSARGKEAGDDLVHTNTHITTGQRVNVQSGGDTTLQGALVKAESNQSVKPGHECDGQQVKPLPPAEPPPAPPPPTTATTPTPAATPHGRNPR